MPEKELPLIAGMRAAADANGDVVGIRLELADETTYAEFAFPHEAMPEILRVLAEATELARQKREKDGSQYTPQPATSVAAPSTSVLVQVSDDGSFVHLVGEGPLGQSPTILFPVQALSGLRKELKKAEDRSRALSKRQDAKHLH